MNDVIGYAFRGEHSKIVFDLDDPMGASTCVACGECVQACPTGALMPAREVGGSRRSTRRSTRSARTAASAACSPTTSRTTRSSSSRAATARRTRPPVREGPLRLRLRPPPAAADEAADPQARRGEDEGLRRWIRTTGGTRSARRLGRGARSRRERPARDPRRATASSALAGFGSAKGTNEEAYLFQKLVRTGFGSNNVDHCTRLCHASSVAALMEGHQLGRGVEPGARRDEGRGHLRHRRQSDGEPPGRGDLDQERGEARREAHRRRSAPHRSRAPRDLCPAVQRRHRRRAAERDAARHRRGGSRRRGVHPRPHLGLRGAAREREEVFARERWRRSAASPRRRSARSRASTRPRRAR